MTSEWLEYSKEKLAEWHEELSAIFLPEAKILPGDVQDMWLLAATLPPAHLGSRVCSNPISSPAPFRNARAVVAGDRCFRMRSPSFVWAINSRR